MTDAITNGLRGAGERLSGLPKVFQGFKDFIARGNVVELAVAVAIGAAFTAVVTAINSGLITPLIAAIFGKASLVDVASFWINGAHFSIGLILDALIRFLVTAAAIYFLVVVPLNALAARRKRGEEAEPAAPAEDILLLQEIRDLLAARPTPAVMNDAGTGPRASDTGPDAPRPPAPPAPRG